MTINKIAVLVICLIFFIIVAVRSSKSSPSDQTPTPTSASASKTGDEAAVQELKKQSEILKQLKTESKTLKNTTVAKTIDPKRIMVLRLLVR